MRSNYSHRAATKDAKRLQILLVEDEPQIGKAVELMLKSCRHKTDWVTRGEEAVAHAVNQPYDLILLDVMLPGMDGYEVLQQLRAAGVETPVIIQTGLVRRDEAKLGFSLGVADYLVKPFNRDQLVTRIDLALARTREEPPEEPAAPDPEPEPEPEPAPGRKPVIRLAPRPGRERRESERSSVLQGAVIVYRAATCTMDCVVLNLSDGGAALQPADLPHCPDEFTLRIHMGPSYRCVVCWRYRNKLGVRFV